MISNSEKAQILELVLTHPDLKQYFHPELKGRVPVKILRSADFGEDVSLSLLGEEVLIVDDRLSEDDPVFEIVTFNLSDDAVELRLNYRIEGVGVEASLKKDAGEWHITEYEAYEN